MTEWLSHYIKLGFEHFYIYDNNSTDKEQLSAVLNKYSEYITLIDWPFMHGNCTEHKFGQFGQINHCIYKYGQLSEYMFIGDVDEYIVPKIKNKTLYDFLKNYDNNKISTYKMQTYWFGVNKDENIIKYDINKTKKILWRKKYSEGENSRTKCIIQPYKITLYGIHNPIIYNKNIMNIDIKDIQINHYYNMSLWRKRGLKINIKVYDNSILNI